jgi:flavin reductase (DIM6/NTAB) family NADH-FMN oxidoreductase RutF
MEKVKLGPRELLYPTPAVLVGAIVDEKPNFMTAAWCGIAASKPPALSVAIRGERHTLKGIEQHGIFSINVAPARLVKEVDYCGIYSGRKRDKSEIFNVFYGVLETAPLVRECPVNLECKTIHTLDLGSHILVVGQIMETYISDDCMTDEKPDAEKIDPLIYATMTGEYRRLGDVIGQSFHVGKDLKK